MRTLQSAALLVAVTALTACQDDLPTSSTPIGNEPVSGRGRDITGRLLQHVPTLDEEFAALVTRAPGFGGFYRESGRVVVYLTDPSRQREAALPAVAQFIRNHHSPLRSLDGQPIEVRQGSRDWGQLVALYAALNAGHVPAGVVYTDIDERSNRLAIGVVSGATSRIDQWRRQLGIPDDAISITETEPITPDAGLRDQIRPTRGGIQISMNGGLCTLGYNFPVNGVWYLTTASHCSPTMLGYDGGTIYQPSAPNMIGTEVVDPPIFTGGSCPAGKKCRWSDALLAQYSNGISAVRRVAATAGYQQMTITDTVHLWSAYGFGYPAEQITGRTSGTSLGSTGYGQLPMCANYYPDSVAYKNSGVTIPSNLVLLCQNAGSYARGGGDSGAPVYVCDISLGYLWCLAAGVHHAGNATGGIYSPISSVQNDLGSMPIYPSTWMGN